MQHGESRCHAADQEKVQALMDSIQEIGLKEPVISLLLAEIVLYSQKQTSHTTQLGMVSVVLVATGISNSTCLFADRCAGCGRQVLWLLWLPPL